MTSKPSDGKLNKGEGDGKWCIHMDVDYVRIYLDKKTFGGTGSSGMECDKAGVNFCPICGTPRPKELTLEEKLRSELFRWYDKDVCERDNHSGEVMSTDLNDLCVSVMEIATEHFEEKPGKTKRGGE